jgi:uncharacterized protein (DUF885 family)
MRSRTPLLALLALLAPFALFATAAAGRLPAAADDGARLRALLDRAWEGRLADDPLFASEAGEHATGDRLPRVGPAAAAERADRLDELQRELATIEPARLDEAARVDFDVLKAWLDGERLTYRFDLHFVPITNRSGFHTAFPQLPSKVPLATVRDYERYVARLRAFRRYADDHVALMRAGLSRGITLPRVVLEGIEDMLDPHVVSDPEQSLLFAPFREFPAAVPDADRTRLTAAGRAAIAESVVPGFAAFRTFLVEEYRPRARASVGASALPDGRAAYARLVRRYTTLELTPEEVHRTGLSEVARIRSEMERVIARTGFEGSFAEFLAFLRTDPRFYPDSPQALMEKTAFVLKKMDGRLPRLFGRLPRAPYGIEPVPDYIAPRTTTAYYERPAGDGTRAGTYFVNTWGLDGRPLYEVEALSLHEAVPGHHLQIALAQELRGLHPMRRFASFGAFVEGWALYAERLGLEAGFYEDPYSDFGRLTYEMWRACRLVVDPGLHALGWTRQQAIDFMAQNTALSLLNVRNEVDRYIAWPGQALGYKIGELKIRELRRRAESRLGTAFDLRAFHDVVLGSGPVPLATLERLVDAWIDEQAGLAD